MSDVLAPTGPMTPCKAGTYGIPARAMAYLPCHSCRFWVEPSAPYCPNCGRAKPAIHSDEQQWWFEWLLPGVGAVTGVLVLLALLLLTHRSLGRFIAHLPANLGTVLLVLLWIFGIAMVAMVVGYSVGRHFKLAEDDVLVLAGAIVGLVAGAWFVPWSKVAPAFAAVGCGPVGGAFLGAIIGRIAGAIWEANYWRPATEFLQQTEWALIGQRESLEEREKQLRELRSRVCREKGGARTDELLRFIDAALEQLRGLRDRHTEQLRGIELLRLENQIRALFGNLEAITGHQHEGYVEELERLRKQVKELQARWLAEAPPAQPSQSLQQLQALLEQWPLLCRELLTRLAVRDAAALTQRLPAGVQEGLKLRLLDELEARRELDEFLSGGEALRREFERLEAESKAGALLTRKKRRSAR